MQIGWESHSDLKTIFLNFTEAVSVRLAIPTKLVILLC